MNSYWVWDTTCAYNSTCVFEPVKIEAVSAEAAVGSYMNTILDSGKGIRVALIAVLQKLDNQKCPSPEEAAAAATLYRVSCFLKCRIEQQPTTWWVWVDSPAVAFSKDCQPDEVTAATATTAVTAWMHLKYAPLSYPSKLSVSVLQKTRQEELLTPDAARHATVVQVRAHYDALFFVDEPVNS